MQTGATWHKQCHCEGRHEKHNASCLQPGHSLKLTHSASAALWTVSNGP